MSDLYRRAALQCLLQMPHEIRQEYEGLMEEFCRRICAGGTRLNPDGSWTGPFPGGAGGLILHAPTHALGGTDPINLLGLAGYSGSPTQVLSGAHTWITPPVAPHAPTHAAGGSDPLNLLTLAGFTGSTLNFLRGDGTFAAPPGGAGGGAVTIPAGPIGGAPALGPADAGALYMVLAPYFHMVRWDGLAWTFAPGDDGNGQIAMRAFAPQGGGWQLCDGTSTDYLVVGGPTLTVGAFVTPNLVGNAVYAKSGPAYNPTVVPGSGSTSGAGVLTTSVGGPASTDAGGPGATAGSGNLYATSTADGAHAHAGGTYEAGAHTHNAWTDVQGEHGHIVPAHGTNAAGGFPATNTDAGTNFFASRSEHSHGIDAFGTEVNGGHGHNIGMDAGGSQHWHAIQEDGAHSHTTVTPDHAHGIAPHSHTLAAHSHTVPDHSHTIGSFDVAHISVLMYFRR